MTRKLILAAATVLAVSGLARIRAEAQVTTTPASAPAMPGSAATGPAVSVPAGAIIAARQSAYDLMQANLNAIKQAVADKADPKPYAFAAVGMQKWVTASPAMFPEGTQAGSHAQPAIWSNHPGFVTAAANFSAAAKKLQDAATVGDKAAFATAFEETGQACGACHKEFRARS